MKPTRPPSNTVALNQTDEHLGLVRALQRSELRRAQLLIGVLACLMLLAYLRHVTGGVAMQGAAFTARLIVLGAGTLYAAMIMFLVRRAEGRDKLLPSFFWVGTAVVESVIPSINIITLLRYARIEHVNALAAPAMIVYFLFTILSVLRLRPALSLLAGGLSAIQHAGIVIYTLTNGSSGDPSLFPFYLSYSALILIGGACAAVVSREIRKHVLAGLREANARAELADVRKSLEIARQIQQSLLPREPIQVVGFEVAAWNRSADETGGDYYDWFGLPDGRTAVVIADVTGHGIGPAMLMAVCRAYARASVPNMDPLRSAIVQLNQLVSHDFGDGRFVTFAVALLSPDHDEIELLSAGHGPTLVCRRAGGAIETFDGDGLPLGIMPEVDFSEPRTICLGRGDTLLLVTDGFMEAHNAAGDLFGISRLSDSLTAHADRPIAEIVSQMDSEVRAFSGTQPQADDMTAVIIRRTA